VETHASFSMEVDRVAKGLMALGVESGDHVGIWMTNRPEWLHLMFAISKVGGCLVPLNTRYRSADMAYTVINAQCSTLVTIDRSGPIDYRALLAEARSEIEAAGHLRSIVMLGEALGDVGATNEDGIASEDGIARETAWEAMLAGGDAVPDADLAERAASVDPDQLMMLAYTSGTTGHPKGVMHTHRPLRNIRERTMLLGHTQNDVHLNYLPLFHIYSLSEIAVMCAIVGSAQVLFESFDTPAVLDAMETHEATVMHGFDSHWADLLAEQDRKARNTSSLRVGSLAAGMKSSIPTARRSQEVFCPTVSGFGMSESWAFICCSHPTDSIEQRTEASGYPMDGVEVEIRDPDTGAVLPADAPGVLFIRNFTVMQGYWANPEATAETIDNDGWLDTGDLASVRPDGHVVLIGRFKDMLKVGGENMSPAEVEGYLLAVPGVAEVAVVAYPDDRLSEVPVAYVVRTKDAGSDEVPLVTEDDLIDPLRGKIASYKIPRAVLFIDEMPMTPSGKIRKVELRARALRDLA
jgi:fatty-acyl-CoA synthase